MSKTIKYLDLFSGIGGFRVAIERAARSAGYQAKCVGYSEIDPFAIKTYTANFAENNSEVAIGDISNLTAESIKKLPDFNALFAGFPCQPFSMMGIKRGFEDTRGTLFFNIAEILLIKQPDFFILENVRGLKTHDGGRTYNRIIKILTEDLGYKVRAEVFNSIDFGVPQNRRRLYFVGVKNEKAFSHILNLSFERLLHHGKYPTTWHLLQRNVDEKYYLSERIIPTILDHGSGNYYSKSEINLLKARPLTASMHKMHRANQDNYYSDDFIDGKYQDDVVTLASSGSKRIRKLTPIEAFRLQGFDDDFVLKAQNAGVSNTQLYKQAGNAITVNVAESILGSIFNYQPQELTVDQTIPYFFFNSSISIANPASAS